MWQVYLYLANEHQVRERRAAHADRGRRWSLRRRAVAASGPQAHASSASTPQVASSTRVH